MYNLFSVRNLKALNNCTLSKHVVTSPFRRPCTFCSHITYTCYLTKDTAPFSCVNSRKSSTYSNTVLITNELKKRRRFMKQKKRFAELLEVISGGHSETVARVRTLKPKDVSLLAQSPDITLEHLHDLKTAKRNKNELTLKMIENKNHISDSSSSCEGMAKFDGMKENDIISSDSQIFYSSKSCKNSSSGKFLTGEEFTEELKEFDGVEDASLYNDAIRKKDFLKEVEDDEQRFESVLKETTKPDYEKSSSFLRTVYDLSNANKEKLAKVKSKDLIKAGKEHHLNDVLLTYLDTCVSCGFLNRGLATLQFYSKKNKLSQPTDIRVFDTLLQGFAAKGKYEKFQEVWNIIKYLKIQPSCESYAARLECIMRSSSIEQADKLLVNTITEMSEEGISLNNLFEKCKFLGDQRELLLDGLVKLYPNFKPEVKLPDLCYSCSLLKKLNEEKSTLLRSPVEGLFSADQLKQFSQEQLQHEIQGTVMIKSVEKRPDTSPFIQIYRRRLNTLKAKWEKTILKALERDINVMNAAQNHTKSFKYPTLFPFLKVLDPEQYKDIIMQEITKLALGSESFSPSTFQLYKELGLKVRSRFIVKFKKDHKILNKTQLLFDDYCDWYVDPMKGKYDSSNSRQEWQQLIHHNQEGPTVNIAEKVWPSSVLIGIGRFLYNIILHDIKIDMNVLKIRNQSQEYLPAFFSIFRQQNNRSVEEIKPHPILAGLFRATEPEELSFDVNLVPMACPPLPWTSPNSGGYLLVKTDFLRLPFQALQQRELVESAPEPQLYPAYDSLNQLSCVPWKVNTKVLDTMIEVFNSGGSSKLEVPEHPSSCPVPEPITAGMSKLDRYQHYKQRLALRRRKAEMYSLWCDALYRLSLANHFRDRVFWLPHNMDFRGRVYPCPPHLNHLGSDLARSLLCFAKGKPLGDTGLDWLKIHVVNLTGLKKRNSVIDRLLYANEIMDDIIDSAQNPLTGRMWWAESECPWQTLACCIEIWNAIQHVGGPASFVSHFPVHQDGSCNGLQHYAALGRDKDGAASVNLSSALVPQDVYSCVAAIVEKERAADAERGVKVAQQLDGFIQRKVIKQTVMTTVYGVTRFGARLQIAKQLKDIDSFPKDYVWSASTYLVGKTFESLRQMFTSTKEIQDWFTECARLISQVRGVNVEYVTPLGLPVVQPYSRSKVASLPVNTHGRIVTSKNPFGVDKFERPNVMKQKNAFPPNFIHSLDSSHMMLTSLHCEQEGITFVSVHDCFWTHPCTIDIMNRICREQFVALHSQPILEDLSVFLLEKFGFPEKDLDGGDNPVAMSKLRLNRALKNVPPKGQFQLENVLDSIYFFS